MDQAVLHRSLSNRIFAGVCGGLAEYFKIDPTFIRVIFVALSFWGGIGLILYLILAIVLPVSITPGGVESKFDPAQPFRQYQNRHWVGLGLILLGGLFLLSNLHLTELFLPPVELSHILFPVFIIYLGIWFLTRTRS